MKKALITARFAEEGKAIIEPLLDITYDGYGKNGILIDEKKFCEMASEVEVLIVELQQVTKTVIEKATHLEVICSSRGTPNNVDIEAANSRGIPVLHAPGRNAISVAEHVLSFMLNLSRNVLPSIDSLRDNKWGSGSDSPFIKFRGREIFGKTIGIVGYGAIGREVAKRTAALGMQVFVSDPYISGNKIREQGYKPVNLEELLTQSDFITLHVMPNEKTLNMIGVKELAQMKRSAFLINTASGKLVDENALLDSLRNGGIAGAGLDVFAVEPLQKNHSLLTLDNVIATPHIGGATFDVETHQSIIIADGLKQFLSGHKPQNIYNPEVFSDQKL